MSFTDKIKKHDGIWSRDEAIANPNILYVFTDNTDRDSGKGVIPNDSWYSAKYGCGHHFPTITSAVIRGLNNARPISTQRLYHNWAKSVYGRLTDNYIDEFKNTIIDELKEIVSEFTNGNYEFIMFPDGDSLFNRKISNITKERTPKLYKALEELLCEFGFDILVQNE